MSECIFCRDQIRAGKIIALFDYRGGCSSCQGEVLFHMIWGMYLGPNRDKAHVLYVWPYGFRCNSCGGRLNMIAVLCNDVGLNVTAEFLQGISK